VLKLWAIATAAAVILLAGGCGSSSKRGAASLAPVHGNYAPKIDPADFVSTVDNPYWPLKPGTGYHFKGTRGTTPQTDDELVLSETKRILGIHCAVVRDTVSEHGRAVERTLDYYAQDKQGNVWYMGEDSFELKNGRMAKAGDSWLSGVNGAKPGIIMPAHPKAGDDYRQEYYPPGQALDEAHVLGVRAAPKVPYRAFGRALATSEFSPLEPQTEEKYYVRGVGEILERVVKGHHEEFELVGITH
jgi:hypothetical protein